MNKLVRSLLENGDTSFKDTNSRGKAALGDTDQTNHTRSFEIDIGLYAADGAESVPLGVIDIEHTGNTNSRFQFHADLEAAIAEVCKRHNATFEVNR